MKSIEYDKLIADRQRRSILAVIQKKRLTVLSWAGSAGISEGAVRNFLSGLSSSITTVNAQKLAETAGVPISELLCGANADIRPLAGYITNGATIHREASEPTQKEQSMLQGAEYSATAEIFRIRTNPSSIDDGALVVFDGKITQDFDRYLGKQVLVKVPGEEEMIKRLYPGSQAGRYNLQACGMTGDNSALKQNVEIEWCALLRQILLPS
jgi:transcriptional regulator with XRE-family HTH domain